ncbi:MAG: phage holin [Anaerovoracaceae bacterium]
MEEKKVVEFKDLKDIEEVEDIDLTEKLETGISAGTIARTIVTALAALNAVLALTGKAPLELDENTIYLVCTGIAMVGTTTWSWWKNNSFTKKAIKGDLAKNGVLGVE